MATVLGSEITVVADGQTEEITVTLSDSDAQFYSNAAAGYATKALQYKNAAESALSNVTSLASATSENAEAAASSAFTAGEYASSAQSYMNSASNSQTSAALSRAQALQYKNAAESSATNAQTYAGNASGSATAAQTAYENISALNPVKDIAVSSTEYGGLNPYSSTDMTITKVDNTTQDINGLVKLYSSEGTSTTGAMTQNAVTTALSTKQNTLTAGTNITIVGDVISASGGGAVDSVNGQTGVVVLDASDVGALADNTTYVSSFNGSTGAITYTAPVTSVNGSTGAVTLTIPDQASEITNDSTVTGDYVDDALDTLSTQITNKQDTLTAGTGITITGTTISATATGLTQTQIDALDAMFKICAYTEDATTEYTAFRSAFGITDYTITNNLTHVTNSNASASVSENFAYSATLTGDVDYLLNSVTVTMGGSDVTASVYSNGTISIPAVTGNVVITATASQKYYYDLTDGVTVINASVVPSYNLGGKYTTGEIVLGNNDSAKRRGFVNEDVIASRCLMATSVAAPTVSDLSETSYYPFPIPVDATSVSVAITESTQYISVILYTYDDTNHYVIGQQSGWKLGSTSFSFTAGAYQYASVSSKYDSNGKSYPTEPTGLTITFSV